MLCQLFGASRSGYCKWRRRREIPNRYRTSQQILDDYIGALHKAYRALNGRLRAETGWLVSDLSVLRSMQRPLYKPGSTGNTAILTQASYAPYFQMFLTGVSIRMYPFLTLPPTLRTSCTMGQSTPLSVSLTYLTMRCWNGM